MTNPKAVETTIQPPSCPKKRPIAFASDKDEFPGVLLVTTFHLSETNSQKSGGSVLVLGSVNLD